MDLLTQAIEKDHQYAMSADSIVTTFSRKQQSNVVQYQPDPSPSMHIQAQEKSVTNNVIMDYEEEVQLDFCDSESEVGEPDNTKDDPDYVQPEDYSSDSDTSECDSEPNDFTICEPVPENPAEQCKFLVFESSLMELFQKCQKNGCSAEVISMQKSLSGSRLIVKTKCAAGCNSVWSSQPTLNKMGAGNLLLSAAVLFSGNTYSRLHDIADHLHMPIVGETQFYNIQRRYLFPIVNETWLSMQTATFSGLCKVQKIVLSGDGRCDSPGHCAKYLTYSLMDEQTGFIVEFSILSTADPNVKNSNAMEPMGLRQCLDSLKGHNINIAVFTTDRHVTIRKIMRVEYPEIVHQFDVWHLVKSIVKKLCAAAKQKGNEAIFEWIQSISNHLWWCAESCGGDAEILIEKWQSLIYHTVGIHSWHDKKKFHQCAHAPLSEEDKRQTSWLRVGSSSHDAVKKAVQDKYLLKDLPHVTMFCHTGQLEMYHSLLLKYAPKRQHFSHEGMVCRTQLAAIDHNYHLGRQQATTKTGEPRYNIVYPKHLGRNKKWVAKTVKEQKEYPYREDMMKDVVAMRVHNLEKSHASLPAVNANIARVEKPSKSDVIARTRQNTRFASKQTMPDVV